MCVAIHGLDEMLLQLDFWTMSGLEMVLCIGMYGRTLERVFDCSGLPRVWNGCYKGLRLQEEETEA